MSARAFAAALATLALLGCSGDRGGEGVMENVASIHLDEANRDANAPAIAAFFNRTCIQAGESAGALSAALDGSGWPHDQAQTASGGMPIAAWRLESGEIVHSAMSLGADNNFIDCELVLDAEVSPALERLRDALRPLLRHATLREISAAPPELRWQWQPAPRDERILTVGTAQRSSRTGARPGLSLHLRITETAAPPPPPPELNEIGIEAANVQ